MSDAMRDAFEKVFYGKPTCEADYLIAWSSDDEFKKYLFTFWSRAWKARQELDAKLCKTQVLDSIYADGEWNASADNCAKLIEETL